MSNLGQKLLILTLVWAAGWASHAQAGFLSVSADAPTSSVPADDADKDASSLRDRLAQRFETASDSGMSSPSITGNGYAASAIAAMPESAHAPALEQSGFVCLPVEDVARLFWHELDTPPPRA